MSHLSVQNLPASPPISPRVQSPFQLVGINGDSLGGAVHESRNTSQNGEGRGMKSHQSGDGRVMILCFDGTGNQFGTNSNVVRFLRALEKDDRKKQIVYYQPGIGSYNKHVTVFTRVRNTIDSAIDAGIALTLNAHVTEGYQFIAQHYRYEIPVFPCYVPGHQHRPGDKICIFGFSRGAHAARVLAGMVYKVGVLPTANMQQLDFAFSIYNTPGYDGYKRGLEFKRTFTLHHQVSIDFVGVWDTVVGIVPKEYPYTSVNYAVKKFRHALSLDERRAAFRPDVWSELTPGSEHELDVDMPVPDIPYTGKSNRGYNPPERDLADVKEVWFAGTHADVGGGSHIATQPSSLSFISLRWMIKECILSETGIRFDLKYLEDDLNFDFDGLLKEIGDETEKQKRIIQYNELKEYRLKARDVKQEYCDTPTLSMQERSGHAWDIIASIFDQLVLCWLWWVFEMVPMRYTYQDYHGNWIRRKMCNFGRGRYIPVYKDKVLVHSSVKERIHATRKGGEKQSEDRTEEKMSGFFNVLQDRLGFRKREEYTPRAYNWDHLEQQKLIEWVD